MGKSSKKFWMWMAGIIVILLIASIIAWLWIKEDLSKPDSFVEKKISEQFTNMIVEASDSLYQVSFSKFDFNLNSGKGLITDFKLVPDSTVLSRLARLNRAPNNVMSMSIKMLHISGVRFTKTADRRKLAIQKILIQEPLIRITNKLQTNQINSEADKKSKFFSFMQTILKYSIIGKVTIQQMEFTYLNDNGTDPKKTSINNVNLDISGITASKKSENGVENTVVHIVKSRLATPDSLYYLYIDDFAFRPQQGVASLRIAELSPRLGKRAFFQSVKWAKDRIHLVYRGLTMKRINLEQLIKKQQIHIGLMETSASYAEVYTNYNWRRHVPPIRHNPFPQQQLKELAFDITIDTMKLRNSDTYWRVLAKHSDQVSSLGFLNSKGSIFNITNNMEQINRNGYTTVSLESFLNGVAPQSLTMRFNLKDEKGAFSVRSIMGKMNATYLNSFSEPFSMMRVKTGTIDKMELSIQANEYGGTGNVNLYYTGMKVALLKKDKKTNELQQRTLVSAISNAMLPNDNPSKNGKFKKGPINVKRDLHQSFFGFLSKCMLDGMTSAMTGLEQNKETKDDNVITKVGRAIIGNPAKKE